MHGVILFIISMGSSYFLRLSPGVMSQGLGGTSIMYDEGLSAFHNPATIQGTKFNFTLSRWLYSTHLFSFGVSFNENCVGLSYLNYGAIQGYNEFGIPSNTFTPFNICAAFGRKIGPLGISVKTFSEKIDSDALYGLCGGVSTYIDFKRFAIGAKVDNLGKEFSKNYSIPLFIGIGLKITLPRNINIVVESKIPDAEVNAGLLYGYQRVKLLFGLKYLRSDIRNSGFRSSDVSMTSGVIIRVENYDIGYSLVYTPFAMAHQFSLLFVP